MTHVIDFESPDLASGIVCRPWAEGAYHQAFPSWQEFWDDVDYADKPVRRPAALDQFIATLRRGQDRIRVDTGVRLPPAT